MASSLLDNNDALRAVLVRTCASDHSSLRLTCRRFREILDSPEFRRERCESGYAEIKAVVFTPFELYKDRNEDEASSESDSFYQEYYDDFGYKDPEEGYQQNRAHIFVDGKKAGTTSFTLLPRNKPHHNFHSMADAVSQDLQSTACLFFDRKGKPRLKSIQKALDNDSRASFLYIASFLLDDPAHRTTSWTGARALRSLLMETTLKDRWSIAIYIPEAKAQFSKDDVRMADKQRWDERELFLARAMGEDVDAEESEEEKKEVKDWEDHCDALTKQDMRQFLQAGFEQAKDAVQDSKCFHVFAVPSFIDKPMLSNDESMSISIAEKHPAKEAPSGDALRLLNLMKTSCAERKQIVDQISNSERILDSPRDHPAFRQAAQMIEKGHVDLQSVIDTVNEQMQQAQLAIDQTVEVLDVLNDDSQAELVSRIVARSAEGLTRESMREDLNRRNTESHAAITQCRSFLDEDVPRMNQKWQEAGQNVLEVISRETREAISKLQQTLQEQDARVRSKVTQLIAASGPDIIWNSDALHACAYNLEPEYLKTLMSFVPDTKKRQAINSFDQHGFTVLMTAAMSGNYNSFTIGNRLKTCEAVIELGADKDIPNESGLTALGTFRKSSRDCRDFYGAFGTAHSGNPNFVAMSNASPAMEALLRPWRGATAADDAFLEVEDEEDDDEDEDSTMDEQEDVDENEDAAVDEEEEDE